MTTNATKPAADREEPFHPTTETATYWLEYLAPVSTGGKCVRRGAVPSLTAAVRAAVELEDRGYTATAVRDISNGTLAYSQVTLTLEMQRYRNLRSRIANLQEQARLRHMHLPEPVPAREGLQTAWEIVELLRAQLAYVDPSIPRHVTAYQTLLSIAFGQLFTRLQDVGAGLGAQYPDSWPRISDAVLYREI